MPRIAPNSTPDPKAQELLAGTEIDFPVVTTSEVVVA
jgi:hypothetical protein